MVDERLIIYIRDCLRRGHPVDSIRQTLVSEGWNSNDVNEAIDFVRTPPPPRPPMDRPTPKAPSEQPEQQAQPKQPPQSKPSTHSTSPSRPTGITIICVLGFLVSILGLVSGILLLGLGGLIGGMGLTIGGETASIGLEGFGSLFMVLGFIPLIVGVVGLVAFYLLLKMKKIGLIIVTTLGVITIAQSILPSLMSFSIEGLLNLNTILIIVLWAVIIGYLLTKKKLFV
ncbi:MAG: hypothetical protein V3U72_00570 [Candidatus Aenigmarchaeota archaeon]